MLVSFATYNLWLDWKKIAPHLARVFLDYEPGIHYPQLQMQAGTTGINAMRVYNVTKQGKDQDPKGIFIRKYVPELRRVPDQYVHEPWNMSETLKQKYYHNKAIFSKLSSEEDRYGCVKIDEYVAYSEPIVDEKESAKIAKEKLNAVKKEISTRTQANQVFIKHGSRSRQSNEMNARLSGSGVLPAAVATFAQDQKEGSSHQPKIKDVFAATAKASENDLKQKTIVDLTTKLNHSSRKRLTSCVDLTSEITYTHNPTTPNKRLKFVSAPKSTILIVKDNIVNRSQNQTDTSKKAMSRSDEKKKCVSNNLTPLKETREGSWSCTACTFLNEKPHGLVCTICGTRR